MTHCQKMGVVLVFLMINDFHLIYQIEIVCKFRELLSYLSKFQRNWISSCFGAGIPAHISLTCKNVPAPHQENQVSQKGSLPLTISEKCKVPGNTPIPNSLPFPPHSERIGQSLMGVQKVSISLKGSIKCNYHFLLFCFVTNFLKIQASKLFFMARKIFLLV